jgi:hypothetical protein
MAEDEHPVDGGSLMKTTVWAAFLLLLSVSTGYAGSGSANLAVHIQPVGGVARTSGGVAQGGGQISVAVTASAGECIHVGTLTSGPYGTADGITVSDDGGNVYSTPRQTHQTTPAQGTWWGAGFYSCPITHPVTSVTVNQPGGTYAVVIADAFTGETGFDNAVAQIQLGSDGTGPGTGTDAISSGAFSTIFNGDNVWGAIVTGDPMVPGTGFSLDSQSSDQKWVSENQIQSTAGSVAATGTFTTATFWDYAVGMAFATCSGCNNNNGGGATVVRAITSHSSTTHSGNTVTWNLPASIGSGNTVVGYSHQSHFTPTSITDNAGNSYNLTSDAVWQPYDEPIAMWYKVGVTGNPTQMYITFTDPSATFCDCAFVEYSGATAVDSIVSPFASDVLNPTITLSPSAASSLLWVFSATDTEDSHPCQDGGNGNMISPSGYSVLIDDCAADGIGVLGSPGTVGPGSITFTWQNTYWNAATCSDGSAAGSSGCTTVLMGASVH